MADRLRVAVVVGPTAGGIGRHVHTVVRRLVALGHAVVVVAPAATDALLDWRSAGAELVTAPVSAPAPTAIAAATKAVKSVAGRVDVVHAHGAGAGATAALAGAHPLVVTWHNARPARLLRRVGHPLAERLAARGADLTLAVSPDLLSRAGRAGAARRQLMPATAPETAAAGRSPQEVRAGLGIAQRPLVLAVARLEAQKRLDLLVDATAGWAQRPDRPVVAVAGTGSLAGRLERRARAAASPLLLLGHRGDVPDLMAASDVVVLPSDWEGYPLVAQEALRLGVPLVATAVGGVPALVGDAALLVGPGDALALRTAIEELLADVGRRSQLAAAGVERARSWPTLAETVDELTALYRDLASR
jgi:glycosyltransferase involved in cell wall biosynthesis